MTEKTSSGAASSGLRREIGAAGSSVLVFNGLVGTGIFAAPAILLLDFGAFSPWLYPLFGLITLTIVIGFARAASLFEGTGGPVAYTRAAFGPLASFQVGWIYYVARVSSYAANALVFVAYAGALAPGIDSGAPRMALILGLIGGLSWLNAAGVRNAARALDGVTLLKGLPLIVAALTGLFLFADRIPDPGPAPDLPALEASALFIFYAFIGFETSVVPAGETRDPTRTIPRMLVFTVCATAALYFLIQYAYVTVMAGRDVEENVRPLVAFADVLFGPIGGTVMAGTALVSVVGNSMGSMLS
ncbi:MAG: APC family permease, partial [Pseudomonadota bacterium]